ncbi:MAG: septum formation initiator family protein [Pseudomonadota bacterium]
MGDLWRLMKSACVPALLLCGGAYFAHYALHGAYGRGAKALYERDIAHAEAALADLEARTAELEKRAGLLKTTAIDPDMLDERARALLGYAHPEDIIVPLNRPNALRPAPTN